MKVVVEGRVNTSRDVEVGRITSRVVMMVGPTDSILEPVSFLLHMPMQKASGSSSRPGKNVFKTQVKVAIGGLVNLNIV